LLANVVKEKESQIKQK